MVNLGTLAILFGKFALSLLEAHYCKGKKLEKRNCHDGKTHSEKNITFECRWSGKITRGVVSVKFGIWIWENVSSKHDTFAAITDAFL